MCNFKKPAFSNGMDKSDAKDWEEEDYPTLTQRVSEGERQLRGLETVGR